MPNYIPEDLKILIEEAAISSIYTKQVYEKYCRDTNIINFSWHESYDGLNTYFKNNKAEKFDLFFVKHKDLFVRRQTINHEFLHLGQEMKRLEKQLPFVINIEDLIVENYMKEIHATSSEIEGEVLSFLSIMQENSDKKLTTKIFGFDLTGFNKKDIPEIFNTLKLDNIDVAYIKTFCSDINLKDIEKGNFGACLVDFYNKKYKHHYNQKTQTRISASRMAAAEAFMSRPGINDENLYSHAEVYLDHTINTFFSRELNNLTLEERQNDFFNRKFMNLGSLSNLGSFSNLGSLSQAINNGLEICQNNNQPFLNRYQWHKIFNGSDNDVIIANVVLGSPCKDDFINMIDTFGAFTLVERINSMALKI